MNYEKYESSLNYRSLNVNEIFSYQNEIFFHYLGIYPNSTVRLLSPFQDDSNPGCRFEYYDSLWWFVDNKTYNNKLYFNCIDFVKTIENVEFKEAVKIITNIVNINKKPLDFKPKSSISYKIKIKFTYLPWSGINYFTKYKLDNDYLNLQPYYNIDNYWCSTKNDLTLVYNRFGKPEDKIAYHFKDTGNTKLYFPNSELKWYANTKYEMFGTHRIGDYLYSDYYPDCIFICSSGKDEMCLNFHCQVPTLGLQSETTLIIEEDILRILKNFSTIYIWLDADNVGYTYTNHLKEYLTSNFPTKNIIPIFHNKMLGKDIADITENNDLNYVLKQLL